jgi:hypothetical protein
VRVKSRSMQNRWLLCFLMFLVFCSSATMAEESFATPPDTLERYLKACQDGDYEAAEKCYTKSSRELVESLNEGQEPRDPAQLRATYEVLSPLTFREERVNTKRAILWPSDDKTPPFLFRIQEPGEGWRIDYHFMSNYIQVSESGWDWRNKRIFNIWKSRE